MIVCLFIYPPPKANGNEPAGVGAAGAARLRRTQQARPETRAANQSAAHAESGLQSGRAHEDQRAVQAPLPRQTAVARRAGHAEGARARSLAAHRGAHPAAVRRTRLAGLAAAAHLAAGAQARADAAPPDVHAAPRPPGRQVTEAALLRCHR